MIEFAAPSGELHVVIEMNFLKTESLIWDLKYIIYIIVGSSGCASVQ